MKRVASIVSLLMAMSLVWMGFAIPAHSQVTQSIEARFCVGGTPTVMDFTIVERGLPGSTINERMMINADGRWTDITGPEATQQLFLAYGFDGGVGPLVVRQNPGVITHIRQNVSPPDRWGTGTSAVSASLSAVEVQTGVWDVTFSGSVSSGADPFSPGDVVRQIALVGDSEFNISREIENIPITACVDEPTTTIAPTTTLAPTTTTTEAPPPQETTTTQPPPTTTTTVEVLAEEITTTTVAAVTLPFTGPAGGIGLTTGALIAVVAGMVLLLVVARERFEDD